MNEIDLSAQGTEEPSWAPALAAFAEAALARLGADRRELSIVLADDETIRGYNRDWRGKDAPTDVLSFVQDEGEAVPAGEGEAVPLGDLVISLPTVERNAREYGVPFEQELKRVTVHGLLHLLGHDHPGDDWDSGMLKTQEELLEALGDVSVTESHGTD